MLYITLENFADNIVNSTNDLNQDGFTGHCCHTWGTEKWYQVDTKDFEYVYSCVLDDGTPLYKGSR